MKKIKARFIEGKLEPLEDLDLPKGQEVLLSVEEALAAEKRGGKQAKVFTAQDSMWNLMGMGQKKEATDVSQDIHKYIADAY